MKRYLLILIFFMVLIVPLGLRWVVGTYMEAPPDDSGTPLVIITPHSESIRREFADAFRAWHLNKYQVPVSINYLSFGGGSDIRRTLEARAGTTFVQSKTYEIDLVWGGGDVLFEQLRPHLQPTILPAEMMSAAFPRPTLAGLPLYDGNTFVDAGGGTMTASAAATRPGAQAAPVWFGTALSSFGISFNRDALRQLNIPEPKTWRDLADPRLRGWVVLADPTRSSSAAAAFMVIVERAMADAVERLSAEDRKVPAKVAAAQDSGWADGMGLIRQIAANARNFNDSAQSLPGVISTGDVAAGMTIDFFARSQIAFVGDARMGYVEPANATIINPDPIAVVKGAPHREIAEHFIEFVLTPDAQRLWNLAVGRPGGPKISALRRLPIVASVYNDTTGFTDQVNPFAQTANFNTSRQRTRTFPILGILIQASCMDLLSELRDTRAAVLASPRAAELDAQLGRFPFDQAEALRRASQYKDAGSLRRLELLRQWSEAFRDEYMRLRQKARAEGG